jgi:raffinose/stachyose/melibiose transport system permease protein
MSRSRAVASVLRTPAVRTRPRVARTGPRAGRFERPTPGMGLGIAVSILPAGLLFAAFFLVPLGVVIVTSLSDWGPIDFAFTGLENYRLLFADDAFWSALRNTALFAAAAALIQVPVGVAVAIILSRRIRGWRVLRTIYFLPNIVSGAALALVYVTFYNPRYGLLNQALGAIGLDSTRDWLYDVDTALPAIAATWVFTAGLVIVVVMAEIAAIPAEVHDAARIDGASRWQATRHITLPLLRNAIGVCVILVLLFTLAYFDGVYIMTGGGPADHTLTLSLYAFQEYSNSNWGYANAVGVLLIAFGLLVIVAVRALFRIGERDF